MACSFSLPSDTHTGTREQEEEKTGPGGLSSNALYLKEKKKAEEWFNFLGQVSFQEIQLGWFSSVDIK